MACKRAVEFQRLSQEADGSLKLQLVPDTVSFTLRAVDSTGAGVAFTVARSADPSAAFHMAAGEAWSEDRLQLPGELELIVASAVGSFVELIAWSD